MREFHTFNGWRGNMKKKRTKFNFRIACVHYDRNGTYYLDRADNSSALVGAIAQFTAEFGFKPINARITFSDKND